MSKILPYITMFLAGALVMAIAALKWFNGDDYDYKTEIKKLKQKKVTGDATMQPIIDMAKAIPKKKEKLTKEQKKAARKNNKNLRKAKRNEKKDIDTP